MYARTGQVLASTTAQLLAPWQPTRHVIYVTNGAGNSNVFLGTKGVTALTGFEIPPNTTVALYCKAEFWVVMKTGTTTISCMEVFGDPDIT